MRASLVLLLHSCFAFEVDERLKMLEGVRFSPEQKHRELLENVIEFGLNQSQYLQEIQERDLWTKGASFTIYYQTRVRSLGMLVTYSLTHSLTH